MSEAPKPAAPPVPGPAEPGPARAAPTRTPTPTPAPAPPPSFGARVGSFVTNALLACAGLGMLVGFFLPWIRLGDVVAASGLSLAASSGQIVDQITGPRRAMLYAVPLSALLLLASSLRGSRLSPWVGIATGGLILAMGFYVVVRVFIDSTGIGMWLVVGSALVAAGVGMFGFGRQTPR